jgi:NAD(P)-dependent dehydrogenase (short-subunit alcohol dehydrogenase family)
MSAEKGILTGCHAVITGGGRGIGAAIAAELARLGATLTLMGRDAAKLDATAAGIRESAGIDVCVARCDVTDEQSVRVAFSEARDRFGDPHILVNNAGQAVGASLADTDLALWNRLLAVNLTGAFLCTREALPAMIEARDGRIVNIASVAGLKGAPHTAAYTASKHGVVGLTRSLAAETAKRGITVNAVCPGYTDTDMSDRAVESIVQGRGVTPEDARAMLARTTGRGTLVQPKEVAAMVGWLCSPAAAAITGEAVVVGG